MSEKQESSEPVKKVVPRPRQHFKESDKERPPSHVDQTHALHSIFSQLLKSDPLKTFAPESPEPDRPSARMRPSKGVSGIRSAEPSEEVGQSVGPAAGEPSIAGKGEAFAAMPMAKQVEVSAVDLEQHAFWSRERREQFFSSQIPIAWALVMAIVGVVVGGIVFYSVGTKAGIDEAESLVLKENIELSGEFEAAFDKALTDIQEGRGEDALKQLTELQTTYPGVATLPLLIANAALLTNDMGLAQQKVNESIQRRESVSDSLVLQAIIEAKLAADADYRKMGSPRHRIEQLLRQAILADSSNARPYFELATLKRFEKKHDEALQLLFSAQRRMNVVDSRFATDLAIALVQLQILSDADLPAIQEPVALDAVSLLTAAYTAMRQGDVSKASGFLTQARDVIPANVLRQLLKDPAFGPYAKDPALADFFKQAL